MDKLGIFANIITIVAGAITLISFTISSQITTGNAFQWTQGLETIHWIILAIVVIAAASLIGIAYRKHQLNHRGGVAIIRPYYLRPVWLFDYPYADVLWEVYTSSRAQISHEQDIQVRVPPKCKNCQTKLEESKGFWGGYMWKCIGCGFSKKNRDYFSKEANRAERLAERQLQEQS